MEKSEGLQVKFSVTRTKELGWRKYFTSEGAEDCQICLFNLPPFLELVDSMISVVALRVPLDRPRSCTIVARMLQQIPSDRIRAYFDVVIPGVSWSLTGLEASRLDERDSFFICIPEKSGITSHEELRSFLLVKYYIISESPLSEPHREFRKKMGRMKKKSISEKDVLAHFDFPKVLSYPW